MTPRRSASNRRAVVIAGAVAMAMALTALIFVLATPGVAPATPTKMQWESLAQRSVRTSMLPEEDGTPPAEEAPAEGAAPAEGEEGEAPAEEGEEAGPEAVHEPGFVIATTDDSSPPPVASGATFHHIKNFAGTDPQPSTLKRKENLY